MKIDIKTIIADVNELLSPQTTEGEKEKLTSYLTERFTQIENEVNSLTERLVSPEQSFEELIEEITSQLKEKKDHFGDPLYSVLGHAGIANSLNEYWFEFVKSDIDSVIQEKIADFSEGTLWYYRNSSCNDENPEKSDREVVITSLYENLLGNAEVSLKQMQAESQRIRSVDEVKLVVIDFAENTMIDTKSVKLWLREKLEESSELDRMTSGILFNMVESVIESLPQGNCESLFASIKTEEGEWQDPELELLERVTLYFRQYLIEFCAK